MKMFTSPSHSICRLCGHIIERSYSISDYDLGSCRNCKSVSVLQMPEMSQLETFYQGFSFQVNLENLQKIETTAIKKWMNRLVGGRSDASMLDVGGGGGFFAKVFEDFGFGESTYIDLDREACDFAVKEIGLERVVCDKVENLKEYVGEQKFDFIYCRHVIEHLIDPGKLVIECAEMLSETGVFILQCPNGESKEGLLFPDYWMRFLRKVKSGNSWSTLKALTFSLSSKYGWGIDPIRHLWAISGKGIESLFENNDPFDVVVKSASIADPVYSPYWFPKTRWYRFATRFARRAAGTLYKGMHLVVEIRRK